MVAARLSFWAMELVATNPPRSPGQSTSSARANQ